MPYPQVGYASTSLSPGSLVGRRRKVVQENTLLYQLDVLKSTGRYDAFKLQWHPSYSDPPMVWPIPNHLFWDSDIAKWIEGACCFLKQNSLPKVKAAIDELVDMIRSAQHEDGYLNIHYTVVEPGKRFSNLKDMHELYNAGHLIEAALAHRDVFQNDQLLEPIVKYVGLLSRTFGPGPDQLHGYPGHPEIELALLRLFEVTQDPKHLELATFFINERGNPKGQDGKHYFHVEAAKRGDDPNKRPAFYPEPMCLWYHQAHLPIIQQPTIEGHSVRAVYLLTAVADLVRIEDQKSSPQLTDALYRLWDNMVSKKMYVTGGIGATKQWEGFNIDYFLPQGTDDGGCYAETCASIGLMMLAERMLQIDLDSRFADVMELAFYNTVLTSMSFDGKRFTYENQLASSDKDASKREEWFTCACCPPNVTRLLGMIGGYVWDHSEHAGSTRINVHLYVASTLNLQSADGDIKIEQSGDWPWKDNIQFSVSAPASSKVDLRLRIPQTHHQTFKLDPPCPGAILTKGYLAIPSEWLQSNPKFTLTLPTRARFIIQHPLAVPRTIAVARGPIIYCAEDVDNSWVQHHFRDVAINTTSAKIEEKWTVDETTGDSFVGLTVRGGVSLLDTESRASLPFEDAGQQAAVKEIPELNLVPYYFRANRGGKGQMRVGFKQIYEQRKLVNGGHVANGTS